MDTNVATPIAAFIAGLATSVHCTAMCGSLVCALRVRPVEYHLSRVVSYSVAGALSGAIGRSFADALQGELTRVVPWAFALVLLALGFGLDKRLPQPRFAATFLLRAKLHRTLGLLTPMIPCGPLWLMIGAAALTGSATSGALHMASFVAGTIPLPFLFQTQFLRLQHRLSLQMTRWVQQGLAFISAGILVWRSLLPLHASCH